jgi:hypothetical protein
MLPTTNNSGPHNFAADVVGKQTKRNLEQSLRETIRTKAKPDGHRRRALQISGIVGES